MYHGITQDIAHAARQELEVEARRALASMPLRPRRRKVSLGTRWARLLRAARCLDGEERAIAAAQQGRHYSRTA